ncbi:IS1182 family transposase [Embleya sp. NBC_00888]|uniref:IS1182 family transposase n=1 Tax=Embleya sp. NBC_00888 TaxID=2975960 RepID=UPI003864BF87
MGSNSGAGIPVRTLEVARAANPHGTTAMWVRDRLSELFTDEDFADWYPSDGRRGISPARLALVSVLQFAENLTDRQAAESVRCRIDWKYALGLELDDPGFDYSVLSEFRNRVAEGDRADRLPAVFVERLVAAGLVRGGGRQRTDSTHVLAAVRRLNRAELVGETLRCALEALAAADETWLAPLIVPGWAERYGRSVRYDRLPKSRAELDAYVEQVGADGMLLLRAAHAPDASPRLRALPSMQVLRQVWVQQYWYDAAGRLRWRGPKDTKDRASRRDRPRRAASAPAADGSPDPESARVPWSTMEVVTPHDPEARFCHKAGKAAWVGYRVHLTETCDTGGPNVIVHVATAPAPEQDIEALDGIHAALVARRLAPHEHLVDAGYVSAETIRHAAATHGIDPTGPVRVDPRASDRPGFAKEDFTFDWDSRTATCPRGVTSPPWKPTLGDQQPRFSVLFPKAACRACEDRLRCTGNTGGRGRHPTLMPRPLHEIQSRVRRDQQTPEWRRRYAMRAGCEATVSETVRAHGMRNCRYRGIAKTHVQHVLAAAGTNIARLSGCLPPGTMPTRTPRAPSRFQRLCDELAIPGITDPQKIANSIQDQCQSLKVTAPFATIKCQ